MRWAHARILTTPEAADALAALVVELGAGGAVIEACGRAVVMGVYFPVGDGVGEKLEAVRAGLRRLEFWGLDTGQGEITVSTVEEDWAESWKACCRPVRVGRVVVRPSWWDGKDVSGEVLVEIDPGMAFGTGAHPTTSMCLAVLQEMVQGGELVFDIGTGSGILAIAAAKLGARFVLAVDVDEVAVKVAEENVRRNGVAALVSVIHGDLRSFVPPGQADVVVANIVADAVMSLGRRAPFLLAPGGKFVGAGIVRNRAGEVAEALAGAGLLVRRLLEDGEWVCVVAGRG